VACSNATEIFWGQVNEEVPSVRVEKYHEAANRNFVQAAGLKSGRCAAAFELRWSLSRKVWHAASQA
jgi:hypothetical protein